ncbi:MAG: IclR family transcriptional regulator [Candidatus Sumerlaeia bacterium]
MPTKNNAKNPAAPAQPNQSLGAGIDCLLALASAREPMGSRPLARKLGLEATKVNRLLGTLASIGLAVKTEDRRYVPGPGLHVLAAMSLRGSRLFSAAAPVLEELRASTGMLVALGVLWRREVCYLFHAPPGTPLEATVAARDLFPAERSAIGLALFAAEEKVNYRKYYAKESLPEIESAVRQARARGYALAPDNVSMAVAVGNPAVAALALADPAGKALGISRQKSLLKKLQRASGQIVEDM